MAVKAVIDGYDSFNVIEGYAKSKIKWLRKPSLLNMIFLVMTLLMVSCSASI
jgi:hypothetical protein